MKMIFKCALAGVLISVQMPLFALSFFSGSSNGNVGNIAFADSGPASRSVEKITFAFYSDADCTTAIGTDHREFQIIPYTFHKGSTYGMMGAALYNIASIMGGASAALFRQADVSFRIQALCSDTDVCGPATNNQITTTAPIGCWNVNCSSSPCSATGAPTTANATLSAA